MPQNPRRSLPQTAEALLEFVGEQVRRLQFFESPEGADARALPKIQAEMALLRRVLEKVAKRAPWRELNAIFVREDNRTLSGAVEWLASLLDRARKEYPTREAFLTALRGNAELQRTILYVAFVFPDLDGPAIGAAAPHRGRAQMVDEAGRPEGPEFTVLFMGDDDPPVSEERLHRTEPRGNELLDAVGSAEVLEILFGKTIGDLHGPTPAAEAVVAKVAGVSRDTIQKARQDLGTLRKRPRRAKERRSS